MLRATTLLLASFFVLVLAGKAQAGDQDFTLVNKTGVVIHHVYVSPNDEKHWGEDILGKDVLEDGQSVEIKFHEDVTAEDWDLKISDKDNNEITWDDLKLTKIKKITLHYDDKKATAEIE